MTKISEYHRNIVIILKNNVLSWNEISKELIEKYQVVVSRRSMQRLLNKYVNLE